MTSTLPVEATVSRALSEVQDMLPPEHAIPSEAHAPLLEGAGGPLDSLGVVNLMVSLESALNEDLGLDVSLAEFLAEPPESSPFRSRTALEELVRSLLGTAG